MTEDAQIRFLAMTTDKPAYPTWAKSRYPMNSIVLNVVGDDIADPPLILDSSSRFEAENVGDAVPPIGTTVVVHFTDGKFVFQYNDLSI